MQPYRTRILGDEFSVYSSLEKDEINLKEQNTNTVIINPSLSRDFEITAYDRAGKISRDVIAPTISAAMFLMKKRGLPLTEFSFETAGANLDVFYTDNNAFIIKPQKCKLLYTNSISLKGCDTVYRDIELSGTFRAISVENVRGFDRELLPLLILSGETVPSSTLASSFCNGELSVCSFSDFSSSGFYEVSTCVVAAYNEYLSSSGRTRRYPVGDGKLVIELEKGFIKIVFK